MSVPRYDDYLDTHLKWIGRIPTHWHLKRLSHHFSERKVKVSDKEYKPLSVTKNGVVPRLETAAKSQDGDNRKLVVKGDFVINSRSDRKGSSGLSPLDGSVSLICTVLVPQDINPNFAHYLLKSSNFQEEYYRFGKGIVADLWSTNFSDMKSIQLPIPTSPEQEKIALFLDFETAKIDTLIDDQKRLIELLKEKRHAVINNAITKGLNPDIPMKDSGVEWIGLIPSHWRTLPIKYVVKTFEQGWSPQCFNEPVSNETELGVLKVGCVRHGRFIHEENKRLPPNLKFKPELSVKAGDLLISRANTRELVGSAGVSSVNRDNLMISDKIFRLRLNKRALPEFLCFFLSTRMARQQIELAASGASDTMLNIGQSTIREMSFPCPPLEEQYQIVNNVIKTNWRLLELAGEAIKLVDLLKERRSALISAAVTGKIDVRDWQPPQGSDTVEKKESAQTEMQHG